MSMYTLCQLTTNQQMWCLSDSDCKGAPIPVYYKWPNSLHFPSLSSSLRWNYQWPISTFYYVCPHFILWCSFLLLVLCDWSRHFYYSVGCFGSSASLPLLDAWRYLLVYICKHPWAFQEIFNAHFSLLIFLPLLLGSFPSRRCSRINTIAQLTILLG